jgi:hypothetical protein
MQSQYRVVPNQPPDLAPGWEMFLDNLGRYSFSCVCVCLQYDNVVLNICANSPFYWHHGEQKTQWVILLLSIITILNFFIVVVVLGEACCQLDCKRFAVASSKPLSIVYVTVGCLKYLYYICIVLFRDGKQNR